MQIVGSATIVKVKPELCVVPSKLAVAVTVRLKLEPPMELSAVCQVNVFPDPELLLTKAAAGVIEFVYVIVPHVPVVV